MAGSVRESNSKHKPDHSAPYHRQTPIGVVFGRNAEAGEGVVVVARKLAGLPDCVEMAVFVLWMITCLSGGRNGSSAKILVLMVPSHTAIKRLHAEVG